MQRMHGKSHNLLGLMCHRLNVASPTLFKVSNLNAHVPLLLPRSYCALIHRSSCGLIWHTSLVSGPILPYQTSLEYWLVSCRAIYIYYIQS